MKHSDLVVAVATTLNVTRMQAEVSVAAVLDTVVAALERGEDVKLNNFGGFEITDRAARPGRNPRTGEAVEIPANRSVKFKPAKSLRDALNAVEEESAP